MKWFRHIAIEKELLFLMLSLLAVLFLYPFFESGAFKSPVIVLLWSFILIFTIHGISRTKKVFVSGLFLGLLSIFFITVNFLAGPTSFTVLTSHLSGICLYIFSAAVILGHIFKHEEVSSEAIYGAVSVYLILGIIWATMFAMLNYFQPGAFFVMDLGIESSSVQWADLLYFSYSNLTTLGLGEIIPVTSHARSLVAMESVAGVLYIAVLVSRFMGFHINRSK